MSGKSVRKAGLICGEDMSNVTLKRLGSWVFRRIQLTEIGVVGMTKFGVMGWLGILGSEFFELR